MPCEFLDKDGHCKRVINGSYGCDAWFSWAQETENLDLPDSDFCEKPEEERKKWE